MAELCYGLLISNHDIIRIILRKYLDTDDVTRDNLFKLAQQHNIETDQCMSDDHLTHHLIYCLVVEDPPRELYAHIMNNDENSYFIGAYLPAPRKGVPLDEYLSSSKVADRMAAVRHTDLADYSWYDIAEMSKYLCVYMFPK